MAPVPLGGLVIRDKCRPYYRNPADIIVARETVKSGGRDTQGIAAGCDTTGIGIWPRGGISLPLSLSHDPENDNDKFISKYIQYTWGIPAPARCETVVRVSTNSGSGGPSFSLFMAHSQELERRQIHKSINVDGPDGVSMQPPVPTTKWRQRSDAHTK